ncbi:HD domain-containing protein [Rasiella rasia]|uniref:HD domain-containing protein n=1 Tax=Rasiella rasia TaxID=2744027 RepID=A0A6G6GQU7_9FLAO|nr:HD domain-containing protein [Rasiella rasia]QIE60917.1 HD domain-containing protein [Rasiella rasia]
MIEQSHEKILANTIAFVKKELQDAEAGHDWFHIERVYKNALLIAKQEPVNILIVALAALLHDIADSKFYDGDDTVGPKKADQFLSSQEISEVDKNHVVAIVANVSFKGGNDTKTFHSLELEVVQDADRLDALGAIGIARTFQYGGYKNRKIYDPNIKPKLEMSPEEYKASTAPTINHFYEKLLLLKDKMNTATATSIAQKRHEFMTDYLAQFYAEWNGER